MRPQPLGFGVTGGTSGFLLLQAQVAGATLPPAVWWLWRDKAYFVPGVAGTFCTSELSVEVFCTPRRCGGVAKNPR